MNEELLKYPFDADKIIQKKRRIKRELLGTDTKWLEKNIAILGGSTTDLIKDIIELFLLNEGIKPHFYCSEYGKFWEDGVFDNPELDIFKPDVVLIHTTFRNILNWPDVTMEESEISSLFANEYNRYVQLWESISDKYGCIIIQNNFDRPNIRFMGNKDIYDPHGRTNFVNRLNMAFYDYALSHKGFYIHDIEYIQSCFGLDKWHDEKQWNLYKCAFNMAAVPAFAYNLTRIIKSIYGKNKKALAVDMDNTLWGGVIADDGVENIVIGSETSQGEAFLHFQKYLKELKKHGVILTIDSKNELENAIAGLSHPSSVLGDKDFLVIKANWNNKDVNIKEAANEINIGTDSFVFIDDNPVEREFVKSQMPEVAVVEENDPCEFARYIDHAGFFETTEITQDDLDRSKMYADNIKRSQYLEKFEDYSEYLKSLEMQAEIREFDPISIQRIAQLSNKTNQFNLTTRRYSEAEIKLISESDRYIGLSGKLIDKFGDNGIVSVVIGSIDGNVLNMDLWIMSCRVLKRDMEFAMFDELIRKCKEKRIETIKGFYYHTTKNKMVKDFYHTLGFNLVKENDDDSEWEYTVSKYTSKDFPIELL